MATTTIEPDLSRLRLLQLVSPSLPTGAFTYSQGLEWAVECGWVSDEQTLREWLISLMETGMSQLEIPLLARLYRASAADDVATVTYWSRYLIACRETRELREEEQNRGRAMASLLPQLGIDLPPETLAAVKCCQLTGFAVAAQRWHIPLRQAAEGYLWGWLENIALAGVKIVPLGQTAGQQIIALLSGEIPRLVNAGLTLPDDSIGASCPAQALASSLHETQYTRIYRS
ncbi:urease accessory protein UreF [Sedimenticola sp.]|uniref:urease accessory protein UreF n=1 Tax=Sedimenticola sp. TaxID=1940285 RepID=UPI003D0CB193